MAYDYDIFLSYKSGFPFSNWVHEVFLPFFEPYVENALNRPLTVFVDRTGIAAGDAWPSRLERALACSRCLVAIWSPIYFHSEWCRRECELMLHRERQLGLRSLSNPSGLVLPISLFDGEHFPQITREIQTLDCRKYFIVGDGFKKTELYGQFQAEVLNWSGGVAAAIDRAPRWRREWLSRDWQQTSAIDLRPRPVGSVPFTGLA
jgi:hypothetical protein